MRREKDFRHWRLVDAAVDGKVALFIARNSREASVEHGRVMGMLGDEGIEPSRVRRGAHMDIDFEGGGHIRFVHSRDIRMLQGIRADLAMTTIATSLSHWDRRDVEMFGASWV